MKKIVALIMGILLAVVFFGGCQTDTTSGESDTQNESADSEGTKYLIGFAKGTDTPWMAILEAALVAKADELGVELILTSAGSHADKQISDVESLLTQNVDAIIMNPIDREACGVIVDTIKEKGIPLVEVNTFTTNENYDVYVGSPEEQAGNLQAQWLINNIGATGNLCILYGEMGSSGQIGREAGLLEGLGITVDSEDTDKWIVLAAQTANWVRADAKRIAEDWLMAYGDQIDAICAQDDEMAMGALQAVQEKNLEDKIKVLGIDGMQESVISVGEGGQAMTALQDAVAQGETAIEVAVKLLNGEEVDKVVDIPFVEINETNYEDFLE
ncbi:MAG: substrate-binding domain-containing protein [Eubacteriales bacterium]|nr:substrate-binding domain-containing protein [Eubacteriales bacterium]